MTSARILGTAQDGGFPHVGCRCDRCSAARTDPTKARRVACLGLFADAGGRFLVDATPDLPAQVDALGELSGLLLTHAHMGHVAGLLWLGREAMAVWGLPVWLGPRMKEHLGRNEPWASLLREVHVDPKVVEAGAEVEIARGLTAGAIPVPHRAEWSETYAWRIQGPTKSLLWLPDIDRFGEGALEALLLGVDYALIDGTFWSPDELPGRDLSEIPHPFVRDTARRLAENPPEAAVSFIHLNHSNPLVDPDSPETRELIAIYEDAGLSPVGPSPVAVEGFEITL